METLESTAAPASAAAAAAPGRVIRVAGVPEHFNAPWHQAQAAGRFAAEADGAAVEWTDYPGGTGDMCKALSERRADVAIVLTEGALAHAMADPKVKIVGTYVGSSATWGVHSGAASCAHGDIKDMQSEAVFAISRFGSGSHLMSYVLAESLGWSTDDVKFKVVGGLKGALEELPKDGSLVFMWEKFTTSPWVVDGTFKRIGELPTPWPFFVVAAHTDFLEQPGAKADLSAVLRVVKSQADAFKAGADDTAKYVHEHYRLEPAAATEWLGTVTWACEPEVDLVMLKGVSDTLHRLGKIKTESGEAPSEQDVMATTETLALPALEAPVAAAAT